MMWFAILFFALLIRFGANGEIDFTPSFLKLFFERDKVAAKVLPEVTTSCFIQQSDETRHVFVICPTNVNCYVVNYLKRVYSPKAYKANLDATCEPFQGAQLPVNKTVQLNGVHHVLRMREESTCGFAFVQTLDLMSTGLNSIEQLGGVTCEEVSPCSYQLNYLRLHNFEIDSLLNKSFCRFTQLEHLRIVKCGLKFIEAHALVHLNNLITVDLHGNQLTHLPPELFVNNVHLQSVRLTENQLQFPALKTLVAVNSLLHLLININNITLVGNHKLFPPNLEYLKADRLSFDKVTEIDENVFGQLHALKFLDLQNNGIERFHKNAFRNNLELEGLFLSRNNLSEFPPIGHLTRLKQLKASNNRIGSIKKADLMNCTQLSSLDLNKNELRIIEDMSFDNIRQLDILVLTLNRLSQKTVNLKNANVIKLLMNLNEFTVLSFEIFPRSVEKVSLISNRIETIEPYNFSGTQGLEWNLTQLDLNDNRLTSIKNLNLPPSIRIVSLSSNKLSDMLTLDDIKRQGLVNLRTVTLQNNNISSVCKVNFQDVMFDNIDLYLAGNPFKCTCELWWIKGAVFLADRNIVLCQPMLPHDSTLVPLALFKNENFFCRSDHLDSHRCQCPQRYPVQCQLLCPSNCTCLSDLSVTLSITKVYFQCNNKQFKDIPKDFTYDPNNDQAKLLLDLSSNSISNVGLIDFGDLMSKQFTHLQLSNSSIRYVSRNALDKLIHLANLNLSSNLLEALCEGLFRNLFRLSLLDLSSNRLKTLGDRTFINTVNLSVLYLHDNSLNQLQFQQIIQKKFLKNVTLHRNPWSCDCAFMQMFRSILVEPSFPVINQSLINCTRNGHEFDVLNFNMESCFVQFNVTILVTTLCFAIVSIVVTITIFLYRRELQVLLYTRYGLRIFHRGGVEDNSSKVFDAFIAYNSEDGDFIVEQMLPGLEGIDRPYRLCIHERDFLAGGFIQDNILEAIKISSRTIIVLTENFVKSGWCRFEFKTAHVQMMEDRCPRVLVIVVGEIPDTLDQEMQLYLKTNTYLRWGEKLFWQKLYFAMPDQRVATSPSDGVVSTSKL